MKELVSVIMPVYNTSAYLDECIQSVRNQTYTHWEMLIVDDGSTDGSGKICDGYQELDSRIRVFHQSNGGQSKARNLALKHCSGSYYMFLDSDDRLPNNAMELMYDVIKKNNADICFGGVRLFNDEIEKNVYSTNELQIYDGEYACEKMFLHDGLDSNTWAKLYKKELWNGISFPEGKIFEDVPVMYKIILNCHKIIHCNFCVYEQRMREGSTTKSQFNRNKEYYTEATENVYLDIKKSNPRLENAAFIYYLYAVVDNFINLSCSDSKKEYVEYSKKLKKIIKDNWMLIIKTNVFKGRKLRLFCCYIGLGNIASHCMRSLRKVLNFIR